MSEYLKLEKKAKKVRKSIVDMIYKASSGHPGGALSITDILVSLYFKEMNVDIYKHFGFEVALQGNVPKSDVEHYAMLKKSL